MGRERFWEQKYTGYKKNFEIKHILSWIVIGFYLSSFVLVNLYKGNFCGKFMWKMIGVY